MKKILFINPCLRYGAKRKYIPVGLAYILTAVEKAGIEFELIDMDAHTISMDDLRHRLEKQTYDIYALGCIVSSFRLVKQIAFIIREVNPMAVIIAGNSVAASIPEILLRNTEVNIAIMGEGDITIVKVLQALIEEKPLGGIQGISFLDDDLFVQTPPGQ